ncbi:MAG: 16S rRNA (cytosine(967)-C(5))-methyltransferase RsmB [Nitrospirota bacterium]
MPPLASIADRGRWPARRWAAELLLRAETSEAFAPALLAELPPTLSPEDRGLIHELFYGVLRHRSALDWRLAACSTRRWGMMTPAVQTILRLGAYQLLFLDRIPPHAAVHETVALAKVMAQEVDVGFTNAVLRALERRKDELKVPSLLDRPVDHLTAEFSHPVWLVRRWLKRFGLQRTLALCRANNVIPPTTLRVNTLRITRERLIDVLAKEGLTAEPCAVSPQGLVLASGSPAASRAFSQGWYYVQDEAAQLVGSALAPQPGERILDACAAPGGKSIHLAELMGDRGEIVAADASEDRIGLIIENCRRLGVTSVRPIVADLTRADVAASLGRFDRILVDAPCTALGVLRRHPEAKWHKTEALIGRLVATQRAILDAVAPLLKPGGALVYATCSTEREENEERVEAFLRTHVGWAAQSLRDALPPAAAPLINPQGYLSTMGNSFNMDHFFAARMTNAPAAGGHAA